MQQMLTSCVTCVAVERLQAEQMETKVLQDDPERLTGGWKLLTCLTAASQVPSSSSWKTLEGSPGKEETIQGSLGRAGIFPRC